MTDRAPTTSNERKYRLPALEIEPRRSLPPVELCFGTSPIQALKSRPERKTFGSGMLATRGCGDQRTNTGDRFKPFAGLAGPVPCKQPPIGFQDLALHHCKLCRQGHQARVGCRWYALILAPGDEIQQLLDAVAANTGNNTELCKMRPDRVDQRRTLANKQLPGPV